MAAAADARPAAQVEGYPNKSQEEQYLLPAMSADRSASACRQVILCAVWKVRLKQQMSCSRRPHRPCSSSKSATSPRALCTATPYSGESPAAPFRFRSWEHSWMGLGRHCGSRSGREPRARNGGLGLRCSVVEVLSAITSGQSQGTPNPPGPQNR